jgi:hypothetical protein
MNKYLEVQYIIESINKQIKIETITPNYKLNVNDKVRLMKPKKTLKKTRYKFSFYFSAITDISGKSITISVADGSINTVTRFQAIHIEMSTKIKEAKSIAVASYESVIEIF